MAENINNLLHKLTSDTANGSARRRAWQNIQQREWTNSSVISYRSAGNLLIVDPLHQDVDRDRAIDIARGLAESGLHGTVLLGSVEADGRDRLISHKLSTKRVTVIAGELSAVSGFLGHFTVTASCPGGSVNPARSGGAGTDFFDLILDLGPQPFLQQEVLPPGYYAPGNNPESLRSVLLEIPGMIGEFEKPVYIRYRFELCAHGGKGLTGCRRCLECCPAVALTSNVDRIDLNTSLCQGCGICTVACPTGALSYDYPPTHEWLGMIRELLNAYREEGGARPDLMIYDGKGMDVLFAKGARLPDNLIPVAVEDIGSVGMDAWLAALAWGAGSIALLIGEGTPQSIVTELDRQFSVAHTLLEAMGYSADRLRFYKINQGQFTLPEPGPGEDGPVNDPAGFAPFEKRKTIHFSLDHLYQQAPYPKEVSLLPQGSPFGEIRVDHGSCTLCMSCVAACPVSALYDAVDQPRLSFLEGNCVQCGLCSNVCPEDAITLACRYLYDYEAANRPRVLLEETAGHCIACGRPFASRRMLDRMSEKLAGHWMYRDEAVLRRLQMCEDCRVKDMFNENGRLDHH